MGSGICVGVGAGVRVGAGVGVGVKVMVGDGVDVGLIVSDASANQTEVVVSFAVQGPPCIHGIIPIGSLLPPLV